MLKFYNFLDDHKYTAILLFPEQLRKQMGNGSLAIQLDMNTKQDFGFNKRVKFSKGSLLWRFQVQVDQDEEVLERCQQLLQRKRGQPGVNEIVRRGTRTF